MIASRPSKYGYWISLVMLAVAALFLGLSYYGNADLGIPQQELPWIVAGAIGLIVGIGAGWAHRGGDIVPLIVSAIVIVAVGIGIYQGLILDLPVEVAYIGGIGYVYGIIAGRLLYS